MTRFGAQDSEKQGLPTLSQGADDASPPRSTPRRRVDRVGCPCFSPRPRIRNYRDHS
jgi:hypothetical protein